MRLEFGDRVEMLFNTGKVVLTVRSDDMSTVTLEDQSGRLASVPAEWKAYMRRLKPPLPKQEGTVILYLGWPWVRTDTGRWITAGRCDRPANTFDDYLDEVAVIHVPGKERK